MAVFFLYPVISGCQQSSSGYVPARSISKAGLARNPGQIGKIEGKEIKIWGFIDHGNLYGNDDVRAILQEWWSGYGPDEATWRFNLKAKESDKYGHSFSVLVPNDAWRNSILETFVKDARAFRSTKVYLKGRIHTFDMPTNFSNLTGLYLKLDSSRDILFTIEADDIEGKPVEDQSE